MMKKTKNKILVIFMIAASPLFLFVTEICAQQKDVLKKAENIEAEDKRIASISPILRPKVEYTAEAARDPFQSVAVQAAGPTVTTAGEIKAPPLKVQGLIWGGKFPQAIINNKVVKTGDTVENSQVLSIEKDGVTILFENNQFKLPAPKADVTVTKKPQGGMQ